MANWYAANGTEFYNLDNCHMIRIEPCVKKGSGFDVVGYFEGPGPVHLAWFESEDEAKAALAKMTKAG